MDAQVFQLDAIRSQHSLATSMEKIFRTQTVLAGLALQQSATLFWGAYVRAMLSCHVQVMSSAFSQSSQPRKAVANESNWL